MNIIFDYFTKENINDCKNIIKQSNKLTDNDILLFLTIFKEFYFTYPNQIIDPQFSNIIFRLFEKKEHKKDYNKKKIDTFLLNFNGDEIFVTIPLFYQSHWSLAIFIKQYKILIHFDSIENYHKNYLEKILCYLVKMKIDIDKLSYINTPFQEGSWQCGYYLLMFNYLFLRVYHERINNKEDEFEFIKRIQVKLEKYKNIINFKNTLEKTLDIILNYNFSV